MRTSRPNAKPSRLHSMMDDGLVALQFLTRLPLPPVAYEEGSLARAVKFFPVVGLGLGAAALGLERLLAPHLGRMPVAWLLVLFLVLITGCLHEDALADVADSCGAWTRERRLEIMRDSRIGSYGTTALVLSLAGRVVLLGTMPSARLGAYLVVAQVLCRWSTLPLSYFIEPAPAADKTPAADRTPAANMASVPAPAQSQRLGTRIARLTSLATLMMGTIFSFGVAVCLLRWAAIAPILVVSAITAVSARWFVRRLGGVTGDCFGAVTQVTEIAVYLCGAWTL